MAKTDYSLKTLMTKIGYVFKSDSYIIENSICIGGPDSESTNPSTHLIRFEKESTDTLNETFPNQPYVFFKNIKNAKKEFNENTEIITDKNKIKEIEDKKKRLMKIIDKVDKWNPIKLTHDDVLALFNEGDTITLFTDDKDVPSVTISKSIFPITTEKTFDNLMYAVFPDEEINLLVTCFDCEWFQLYGITQFIDIDNPS